MAAIMFRLVLIPMLLSAFAVESSERPKEDTRKVDYLFQMTKFIHWPASITKHSPIKLCLFSTNPARDNWQKIHLQKSQGHEIQLHYINQVNQLSQCNMLFVHKRIPNSVIQKNYYRLISNRILTIGERKNFAKEGGVIELDFIEGNADIKINLKTAHEAGLLINANLIELASAVFKHGQI
ncbi:MAG: hypothetical protein ACI910_000555 [Oleispira sp.]|jgi:hypothetical protein